MNSAEKPHEYIFEAIFFLLLRKISALCLLEHKTARNQKTLEIKFNHQHELNEKKSKEKEKKGNKKQQQNK